MYSGADTLAGGFPHSEIRGSTIARISPQLIAACHVLHRLLAPRHPPNALIALNTYHQCPHAGPNPTMQSSAYQTNELSFTHSLFCSRHHHPAQSLRPAQHGRSRDQPIRFTCQTSRLPDQIPSGTHHQAANPLCSGTASSKERRIAALNPPDLIFWRRSVSNRRPPACKAGALPLSYAPVTRDRNNHTTRP
jgi:hypothetical protein